MSDVGKTSRSLLAAEPGAKVDWAQVRRRLEQAIAAVEQTAQPAAAEKIRILKARAKVLAREPQQ